MTEILRLATTPVSWFSKVLTWVWLKLDGWKTVLSYVLVQLPWFVAHPPVVEAITKVLEHPDPSTPEGAKAWANLIVQILMLTGVTHITYKNVKKGKYRSKK